MEILSALGLLLGWYLLYRCVKSKEDFWEYFVLVLLVVALTVDTLVRWIWGFSLLDAMRGG